MKETNSLPRCPAVVAEAAIGTLVQLLDAPEHRVRLDAALALLSLRSVTGTGCNPPPRGGGPIAALSDAELDAAIDLLNRHLGEDPPTDLSPEIANPSGNHAQCDMRRGRQYPPRRTRLGEFRGRHT